MDIRVRKIIPEFMKPLHYLAVLRPTPLKNGVEKRIYD
jgi:hypothetical protein